jgi:hypothetical protein
MTLAHAWLQKHASPTARGGEFHWHPASNALPALIERLHGAAPPCVLWELAPGRVVWAQAFAATAPSDGRRYTGLVVTIMTHAGAPPAALLAELRVPPARPWRDEAVDEAISKPELGDGVAIASALLAGGDAHVTDPADRSLPRAIAELEALVPREVAARTRIGTLRAEAGIARLARRDPAAELLAAAWRGDELPWRAACELATTQRRDVAELAREIAEPGDHDIARALTADERRLLGEPLAWPRVVNAWGRGKLVASDAADRLADVLAARVIGELARGRDARDALAVVRWHALLPASRRAALFATLARRATSLGELIHA